MAVSREAIAEAIENMVTEIVDSDAVEYDDAYDRIEDVIDYLRGRSDSLHSRKGERNAS